MLRKLILVAVVGGLAVAAFKGTRWMSYMRSEWQSIRAAAEDSIPPEKEITRLRSEVKMLDDDTLKVVKHLARLQSDQADLVKHEKFMGEKKTALLAKLQDQESAVRAAEEKAKAGEANVFVSFGDQRYSLAVGKNRLKETVREYTDVEKELARTRAKIESQQRIVDKLETQRLKMTSIKGELDLAIDELESDLQALRLQQMEAKYDAEGRYKTDDSRVAQIKEAIAKQRKKFDVQRRELALMQEPEAPAAVPSESVDEIMAPVTGARTAAPTPQLPKAGD